jgi:hypothetical protein
MFQHSVFKLRFGRLFQQTAFITRFLPEREDRFLFLAFLKLRIRGILRKNSQMVSNSQKSWNFDSCAVQEAREELFLLQGGWSTKSH